MKDMPRTWIDRQYPDAVGKHSIESSPDDNYNCIAYAADDMTEWWSHLPGYKWPATRSAGIESLLAVFAGLGYSRCESVEMEVGHVKVALYAKEGAWKHAARQLPSGKWVSKLGPDEDIEHDDPDCLQGESYGEVYCIMKKPQ